MTPRQASDILVIKLLGEIEVERGNEPITASIARKARAVLGYLAMEPGLSQPRQRLAEIFWPELPEHAGRNNLRQVLMQLQRVLGDKQAMHPRLVADRHAIRYDPAGSDWIDVVAFSQPIPDCVAGTGASDCAACLDRLTAMARLYRGELMSGYYLADCPEFEDWLQIGRETLLRRALLLLERLSDCWERRGDLGKALTFALRFAELEPWSEEGQRRIMRLAAQSGQKAVALSQYDAFCQTLKTDLGVAPEEATRALAGSIRADEIPVIGHQAPPVAATPPPSAVERRQVTVVYCQLLPLDSEDPEEALDLLRGPQARSIEIVESFSGHVVRTNDGGYLAYFGFPRAHERAALLAVRAALAVVAESGPGLDLRAGVHTGLILTGTDPMLPDTIGRTSALAIGLRTLAKGGEVVLSETTQRLVAGYFDLEALDRPALDGSRPLAAVRVRGPSGARYRLEAAENLSPLAGRKEEVGRLTELWQEACRGGRRLALLQGDPGIGKSRLIHYLRQGLDGAACTVLEVRCFPELSQSPLQPVIDLLAARLGFTVGDSGEECFGRLARYMERHYPERASYAVPLLATLLSLPLARPYEVPAAPPHQQREQVLELLLEQLHAQTAAKPVLLVVEDLHWIDPTTLELLSRVLQTEEPASLLMLFTARPEFESPWPESRVPRLTLAPLSDSEVQTMVEGLNLNLPVVMLADIVRRADGVPLFVEELAKTAAVAAEGEPMTVPSSLRDLLAARLDGMGDAKAIAQLAATVGSAAPPGLLEAVSQFDHGDVTAAFQRLQEAGIAHSSTDSGFRFRHALFRDAAYESQTRSDRRAVHRRIAKALEADFPDMAHHRPELLAHHLQNGGLPERATEYWMRAGRLAHRQCAHKEAQSHFAAGLELLASLPDGERRHQLELELQVGFGSATQAAEGYGSPKASAAFSRAVELGEWVGASAESFQALWGLWASTSSQSDLGRSLDLARRLLSMAQRTGDPVQSQQAHFAVGNIQFWRGGFEDARHHLEQAMALYEPQHHESLVAGYGENAFATSGAYLSWTLCLLGQPQQALDAGRRAVAEARRVDHPFTLGYALTFFTVLHRMLRQPAETLALAEETIELAAEHNFPLWDVGATLKRGWARVMQGDAAGLHEMRRSVEAVQGLMSGITLIFLETLADALHQAGQYEEALSVIHEAQAVVERLDDHHVEAELFRLKGHCLLALSPGNKDEAEGYFHRALALAREQQARLLEVRAAAGLARMGAFGARKELETVINAFGEDSGIADIVEAKRLLAASD